MVAQPEPIPSAPFQPRLACRSHLLARTSRPHPGSRHRRNDGLTFRPSALRADRPRAGIDGPRSLQGWRMTCRPSQRPARAPRRLPAGRDTRTLPRTGRELRRGQSSCLTASLPGQGIRVRTPGGGSNRNRRSGRQSAEGDTFSRGARDAEDSSAALRVTSVAPRPPYRWP
jgi:hypothetical protein